MASTNTSLISLLFFQLLLLFICSSTAQTSFRPRALILPVTKDSATGQYVTEFSQRRPLVPLKLTVNIARSRACSLDCGGPTPGCNNNTCVLFPFNPIIRTSSLGEVADDTVSLQSTDGTNPGRLVSAKQVFFVCGSESLLEGLGVELGVSCNILWRKSIQLLTWLRCLSAVDLYPSPHKPCKHWWSFLHRRTVSRILHWTEIHQRDVPVNTTLFKIDREGNGGYTLLETSVYDAVTNAFVNCISGIPRVNPVEPFKYCYNSASLGSTRLGPGVPLIELVLQTSGASWTIFGANSMVPFDIARSRFGLSSTLLGRQTICGNFNFTSVA
ncbi:protease [Lithospermum erythrorhizon]|uniref:Protease n=1 Tax=Lithospermum erythrorhizon TaxID=34254 RepID=A0AAV3NL86_LITER